MAITLSIAKIVLRLAIDVPNYAGRWRLHKFLHPEAISPSGVSFYEWRLYIRVYFKK
ncbi:hypothetical protein JOD17_003103 [Geomicrobium sediminis]|uniref:Uncharacterized protein n=1 Tax=Geomicrobium sediminis TaxID=1347788 RepID=A0ABS2PGQ7_9BACL|nr:hypothetical protein [Geomicrobium sediminis]